MDLDVLLLSRFQFALTIIFHYLFPPLSIGLGVILAVTGSAVGLGNIWGFPTQAASNGGAAFLIVYLFLAFVLAYPALMAELIIGRHAHANAVSALRLISPNALVHRVGTATGVIGFIVASLILSFYAIVAGWMIAFCLSAIADLFGLASHDPLTGGAPGARTRLEAARDVAQRVEPKLLEPCSCRRGRGHGC